MTTLIHEQQESEVSAHAEGEMLWLSADDLEPATGWRLKPEGLCRGPICVPLPPARRTEMVRDGRIDVAGLWRWQGHPVAHDRSGETWVLGTGAGSRSMSLQSLEAPDFALSDFEGRRHALSDYRGRRVLLVSWASW